jgi:hypothetical protein
MAIDRRSGRPDCEGRLMTSKFPAHPNPNNVEIPIASAMQAQARPDESPDEDEIDDGRSERKNRMRNWRRYVRPAVRVAGKCGCCAPSGVRAREPGQRPCTAGGARPRARTAALFAAQRACRGGRGSMVCRGGSGHRGCMRRAELLVRDTEVAGVRGKRHGWWGPRALLAGLFTCSPTFT